MPGPLDEDFTDEETAALAALELDNTPPAPEDPDEISSGDVADPAAAPPAAPPAAPAAAPVVVDPAAAPPAAAAADDAAFKEWREANKDKTPEELAQLAFQQSKRADRVSFDHRRLTSASADLAKRAREALDSRKGNIAERRAAFDKRLEEDPDGATRDLANQRFTEEERAAEAEVDRLEREARVDEAINLAASAIPDFQKVFPEIQAFGGEMNYSPEEINAISDGRDVVTLYLASRAASLIKAGIMDMRGNIVATAPPAVADTDPRLTPKNAPRTLNNAASRATDAAKTPEQELADILALSDEEFDKIDEATLRRLSL